MAVFVVGALHFDVVVSAPRLPARDETLVGSEVAFLCGGKGGNQAVAAALHGAPTAMAGRVGDDLFAARLLAHLDRAGVDRSQLQTASGRVSGMSVAIVEPAGDYGAVIVSGTNRDLDPDEIVLPEGTRVLVLQNEIPEAVNLAVARRARAAGTEVLLNAAPMRPMAAELLDLVDLLVVNRVEAAEMTGRPTADEPAALAAAAALADGQRTAIVTLGADGVAVCGADGAAKAQPGFETMVVSTHGAGDVFVGALAARLSGGDSMAQAISYGQAAAARHVAAPVEARPVADPQQVFALMARPAQTSSR